MTRLGAVLTLCLALAGCDDRKPSAPARATSKAATGSAAAATGGAPPATGPIHAFPDRGTRLSGLLSTVCSPSMKGGCNRVTYAVFGDEATRAVDAVWVMDGKMGVDEELRPVPRIPTAIRLLDATSDGEAVLLVESLESGVQPAGLRALLRLGALVEHNGPMPNGLVPPPNLAEALALKLIDPWRLELSTDVPPVQAPSPRGSAGKPNVAFVSLLTRRIGPSGFAHEWVYQGHFRQEMGRVPRDKIARWPFLQSLEKALRDAAGSFAGTRPGIVELYGDDFTDLTVSGTDERPTVRSVGSLPPPAPPPVPREPRIIEAGGPSDRLDALLARQPVTARLVAHAPLGPEGATVGIAVTEPAAAYGPLLLLDDGAARSVRILDGFREAGYLRATHVDFRFLDADGDGITDLLVRMVRPDRPPWAAIYLLLPPMEAGMRSLTQHLPSVELGLWINRAETTDAAVAAALQIPRRGVRTAEAWPLVAGSRTKKGFLQRSARDAVVFSFDGPTFDPFAGGPIFRTRDVVTDADSRMVTLDAGRHDLRRLLLRGRSPPLPLHRPRRQQPTPLLVYTRTRPPRPRRRRSSGERLIGTTTTTC